MEPMGITGFGDRLRSARKRAGIMQKDLAKQMGVAKESISAWEVGDKLPRVEWLAAICDHLDISADWLLGLTRPGAAPPSAEGQS